MQFKLFLDFFSEKRKLKKQGNNTNAMEIIYILSHDLHQRIHKQKKSFLL